jgi:ABC-2 type transport system ATP-binding protein
MSAKQPIVIGWPLCTAGGYLLMVDSPAGLRRRAQGGDVVDLRTVAPLDYRKMMSLQQLPFVRHPVTPLGPEHVRLIVDAARTAVPELVSWCQAQGVEVRSIEPYSPPFDDVFVDLLKQEMDDD